MVFDHKAFKISSSLFDDVKSFIDERYIEELLDEEYRGDYRDRRRNFETAGQPPAEDAYIDIPMWMSKPKECSLEDLLNEVDDTFSEALLRLIDAKGKTDPEVYKKANTEDTYFVRGCTALLDALGGAIHHIGNTHKYARDEDRPEKTMFIITTDGMENASRWYTYKKSSKWWSDRRTGMAGSSCS